MVADAADTSIVGIARLRSAATPTTASPGAVLAVSARARVGRLAWRRTAAVPTLAARNNSNCQRNFQVNKSGASRTEGVM